MKILFISLVVLALLAVSVDAAGKKRKNNHRDRDEGASKQVDEDQPVVSGRRDDDVKQREKKVKEERPLKKADDDESSSEEEEEKKTENATTISPKKRRRALEDANSRRLHLNRSENTLNKAKELDHLPIPYEYESEQSGRARRSGDTFYRLAELEALLSNRQLSRERRSGTHAQTGEVILTRTHELNDGERTPLVIDEKASSRPDYRKSSRTRRAELTLGKAQELNGGERVEISKGDQSDTRPDYRRKNSRTRRMLRKSAATTRNEYLDHRTDKLTPHYTGYPFRRRRNLKDSSSSQEDVLPKAREMNDGQQQPVDAKPSQSQMPEKKAHKRRHARQLNVHRNQPGNQLDERDSEEWKILNEADYDFAGNY